MRSRLACVAVAAISGSAALAAPGLAAPGLAGVAQAGQAQAARASSAPAGSASLGGVLRGLDGKPLRGICVTASGASALRVARSGPGGRYLIGGVPAGAYLVGYRDCAHPGQYLDQWYGGPGRVSLLPAGATRVLVGGTRPAWLGSLTLRSADPRLLHAAMAAALAAGKAAQPGPASARRPVISGVVRTAAGRRARGACVELDSTKDNNEIGLGLTTRSDGSYSIARLPGKPGRQWTVEFSSSCLPGQQTPNYAPQWWRYVATSAKATKLRIGPRSHFTGIDARLGKGASISGVVRAGSAHGPGLGGICVVAFGLGAMSQVSGFAQSAADGSYLITGLGTGRYQVEFQDCNPKPAYVDTSFPHAVAVTDGKVHRGVNAVMQLAATISGTVTGSAGRPTGGVCVFAFPRASGSALLVLGDLGAVTSGSTGHYVVRDLTPGRYTVSFSGCGRHGSYAPQYYRASVVDAGATPVVVRAGQQVTGIDARMKPGGTIAGRVTSAAGRPLTGICVSVAAEQTVAGFGPSPEGVLFAQLPASDEIVRTARGHYRIANLPPGRYQVSFSSGCGKAGAGYAEQWFSPQGGATATWLTVPGGTPLTSIDARMRRQGTVSGVVTGKSGQPVAGICVNVTALSGQPAGTVDLFSRVGHAKSGRTGGYQVTGLAAGKYAVSFVSCSGPRYALTWYPNANTRSSARPVTVTAGHATTGIDQVVVAGRTISGQIVAAGHAAAGVRFCVVATEAGGTAVNLALTTGNGSFSITRLAPGRYTFDLFPCTGPATKLAAVAVGIRVPGGRGSEVVLVRVPQSGSVSGTALGGSSAARVAGLCAEAFPVAQPGLGGVAFTGSQGRYTISGLAPGKYRVLLTAQCEGGSGGFVSQKLAQTVVVSSGTVQAGVNGTLLADGGVAGIVMVSGSPVAGVCAVAYPVNGRGLPAVAVSAASGQYQLAGLPPGRYLVEFTSGCGAASFTTQWFDHVHAKGSATPVRVRAGLATTAIDAN